jgi:Translationally controlled tumour protein
VLWEADCRKYLKGAESFQLASANPSAEGEDEDGGDGEGGQTMVHDIEEQFRLVWLKQEDGLKPSKDAFKSHLKCLCLHPLLPFPPWRDLLHTDADVFSRFWLIAYVKGVNTKLKEKGASEDTIKAFQSGAAATVKKILANYDNYDVLMGQSMDGSAMHVLIDFREDGVTPYATLWKHGLEEMKV